MKPLSTQIYGEYQSLMNFLTTAIQEVFEKEKALVLQMKLFKGDRAVMSPVFEFLFEPYKAYSWTAIGIEIAAVIFGFAVCGIPNKIRLPFFQRECFPQHFSSIFLGSGLIGRYAY